MVDADRGIKKKRKEKETKYFSGFSVVVDFSRKKEK